MYIRPCISYICAYVHGIYTYSKRGNQLLLIVFVGYSSRCPVYDDVTYVYDDVTYMLLLIVFVGYSSGCPDAFEQVVFVIFAQRYHKG